MFHQRGMGRIGCTQLAENLIQQLVRGLEVACRRVEVALTRGQVSRAAVNLGAVAAEPGAAGEYRFQVGPSFRERSPQVPELLERARELNLHAGQLVVEAAVERGQQVVTNRAE